MRDRKEGWQRYYNNNREKLLEKGRLYRQSERGKEAQRRANEKRKSDPAKKERIRIYNTQYAREHYLPVNGIRVRVNKRPRPDNVCELCGKYKRLLHYHHWDNEHPEQGLWLCVHCHYFVEDYEHGKLDSYLVLKEWIERGGGVNAVREDA